MFVSSRPGGIGLGLFLAKTAVDMAGGNINVTGAEGGGSCFQIVLPLVTARGKGSPPHEKA
jgi:signal transduction histidine kinase